MSTEPAQAKRPARLQRRGERWARRYPPLLAFVVALIISVLVMPSALNLPQANPSTVLEYAPIPPESEDQPPPEGALSSLGLGTTGGSGSGSSLSPTPPPIPPTKRGRALRPSTKRCVGNPPRQTEDPMSPPCVAFYEGDNGGETWPGVTGDEIRVMIYQDTGNYITTGEGRRETTPPAGTYCDLDKPAGSCSGTGNAPGEDHVLARAARILNRYFNDRFQTYNRHVHYYMHFTSATSEQGRRSDAADQYATYRPFATMDEGTFGGFHEAYRDAVASRQVTMFSSLVGVPGDQLREYAPQVWNFWPDIEHSSDMYASYVCQKVAPFPVSRSGNANGGKRVFGLMYTTDPAHFELKVFRNMVKQKVTDCGVSWAAEVTFPRGGWAQDNSGDQTYAQRNVAELQAKDVTTILWLGGMESKTSHAAAAVGYFPEWVVAGDNDLDGISGGTFQNQEAWNHASVVSYILREDAFELTPGYQACREGNPNATRGDCSWVADAYRSHFMMYQAIQVAGPELTPYTIDSGFHAIPRIRSTSPYLAAFYFDPDDYTGVKDAFEGWWDATAPRPGSNNRGCYRMVREGRRFPAYQWEGGDDVGKNSNDPCTTYDSGFRVSPAPG